MTSYHEEDKVFSGTQVGALIESFRSEMSVMGERLGSLCEDMVIVKEDVKQLKTDMIYVKDVLRIAIPDLYSRVTALEAQRR